MRSRAGNVTRRLAKRVMPFGSGKERPIEPEYLEWRKFYEDRKRQYAALGDELDEHPENGYLEWYQGGG